ncbi:MAG TPA: pyrroloquinoline quinone-dependent dehydrogenase, partial [Deltaproteobacteria bacterium]|nr:pyrroloquinoline quinone-dependent dehydrogenase [Deltaproteobacteria bacterium]
MACSPESLPVPDRAVRAITEWGAYGGDEGGQRYVEASIIRRDNVRSLRHAWTHHHGDVSAGSADVPSGTAFENTPILVDGTLFFCTPMNRVIALDPVTGQERWVHDPGIDRSGNYANQLVCRGVTAWLDDLARPGADCRRTIFSATNDARLIALDAESGRPCAGFGSGGGVDLDAAAGPQAWKGEYQVTSPPVVVGDVVVVGSA